MIRASQLQRGRIAMTGNSTTADPGLTPSPKVQQPVAELRELAKQFPEPSMPEVMADWEWLYAECNKGSFHHIPDRFIAVCEKTVVGTDEDDELALRIWLARQ